ncbi:MAG: aminodeoxychorismate synthase component I [Planctomycetota bacterium]|nr:MAG: aminodeoxychorismate synthase component I [Planctomycetota bacterium]
MNEPRKVGAFTPLVRPLPDDWTPVYCFSRLAHLPGCVWLDSSLPLPGLGRFSYLAADPVTTVRIDAPHPAALRTLGSFLRRFAQPKVPEIPPMQGGWMGWFAYEMGQCFERLPRAVYNDFSLPLAHLGLYDVVLAWDHQRQSGWMISQGLPESHPERRTRLAYQRLRQFSSILASAAPDWPPSSPASPLPRHLHAPQFSTRLPGWTSNFSPDQYRKAVARCVEHILDGDVFQVNLSQRLVHRAVCSAAQLYMHLRDVSPAPFAGFADLGRVQVVSSSPERFLTLHDRQIESRPIKGTRPRLSDPIADLGIGQLLLDSEKDRAENVMIVDLLRNDLSRVADPDSVEVPELCRLEKYPFVWHLVSVVRAVLAEGRDALDVLQATFPGGSITGAPKIRAMEIIAELERTVRGPYCGSLGYISLAGDMDLSILIRTITAAGGWWSASVGGGIVVDSDPASEEQETWHKAEGMLRAIESLQQASAPSYG